MIKHSLTLAFRNITKQKGFSLINLLGLALGMAVSLLVIVLVWQQMMHDRFHARSERIHRVISTRSGSGFATSPPTLAPLIENQVPGVSKTVRLKRSHQNITVGRNSFDFSGLYAEPSFFETFSFRLNAGDEATALSRPYTVVLTEATARRVFGEQNPTGKTVSVEGVGDFTVTGTIDLSRYHTHLDFDGLFSFASLFDINGPVASDWEDRNGLYYTYLLLGGSADPAEVGEQIATFTREAFPGREDLSGYGFSLQPLTGITMGARLANEINPGMLPSVIAYFLGGLALVILLAAVFNYVNLSIARGLKRAREVGVRKVVGGRRRQIIGQFLLESVLLSLGALTVSAAFLQAIIPVFNSLSVVQGLGIQITSVPWSDGGLHGTMIAFAVLLGLMAGLYPAWHLSRHRPAEVLTRDLLAGPSRRGRWLSGRRLLIGCQLVVTFVLVVSSVLGYRQSRLMLSGDYGFETEDLVVVDLQGTSLDTFTGELRRRSEITAAAVANPVPTSGRRITTDLRTDSLQQPVTATTFFTDYAFFETLGLSVTSGDNFTKETYESGQSVVINQLGAKQLGFTRPREAVGQTVLLSENPYRIGAVVEDFRAGGPSQPVGPMVFQFSKDWLARGSALIRVNPGQEGPAIAAISDLWQEIGAEEAFQYQFFQDFLGERLAPFTNMLGIVGGVAGAALFISCLGLLGIVAYSTQLRLKEVAIRKVQGAEVKDIILVLSKEYLAQILLAFIVGVPLAWLVNSFWLQNFAYRVELGALTYSISIGLVALITCATIGSQTIKAARANPADLLRYE